MQTTMIRWVATIGVVLLAVTGIVGIPQAAQAVSASSWDPGNIISDATFTNTSTMSQQQIQDFLVQQEPTCSAYNGMPCMRNYTTTSTSRPADADGRCAAYTGAAVEYASAVIYKVAQACKINPQVLLVLLEKEEGLVSSTSPTPGQYRIATGYGCPDTAACDTSYYGFYNQLYSAARQFKTYSMFPRSFNFRPGVINVGYNPNSSCGSSPVNIQNLATAALYNYTPYQPNAAALANLGGVGDACSSYGNRNFWAYFNNWFGSPVGDVNPFGAVDSVIGTVGAVHVQGWAIDPDTSASIPVHVYIDGIGTALTADQARPDVATVYPSAGAAHGFSADIPVPSGGTHHVCLYGINIGPGTNVLIGGCWTTTTMSGSPVMVVDSLVAGAGQVKVSGWAFDPDTASPITVRVSVDGTVTDAVADGSRSDFAAAYPGYGPNHAYSITVNAGPGSHTVCLSAINVGGGSDTTRPCTTVNVTSPNPFPDLNRAPFGVVDAATISSAGVAVSGWAIDPDTSASIRVHVYIDSVGVNIPADGARTDVAAAYPGYGPNHSYATTVAASPGAHSLCIYAINNGAGPNNTVLTCRTIVVPYPPGIFPDLHRAPFGVVDAVTTAAGAVTVAGWAIDPDTAASIRVHVYIDTVGVNIAADGARADVSAAYPGYGPNHAYATTVATTSGAHSLCIYAINNAAGPNNTILTCRTVTVP